MSRRNWINSISLLVCLVALFVLPQAGATDSSTIVPGHFHFKTFQVANQFALGVENINNFGLVVGYYQTGTASSPGPTRGFELFPYGKFQTLIDPLDVEGPNSGVTEALGVNDWGVIVGEYFDTAAGHYSGFFLHNGKYTSFNVPGHFNTVVFGINNDVTDFVGIVQTAGPAFFTSGFVSDHGQLTVFTIPGATFTEAVAINNLDQVVGIYEDASGVFHGFTRDRKGHLTCPIDVPGASTAAGLGTVALGINDLGVISGHFWDASNIEHGFVRTPSGRFFQIDVPGAASTAGGGLNDFGVVVGHYNDQSGNQIGYIAIPDFDEK